MTNDSTSDQVLRALHTYGLVDEGAGKYRADSPLRPGSNSHAFSLKIDGPEHGAWHDHVTGESGSLYELAEKLGIPTPKAAQPASTKRGYTGLADYAQAHGVTAQAYAAWGWTEAQRDGRPALEFPTASGPRWRFLDDQKPPFTSPAGYQPCWYGLGEAAILAQASGQPLVLTNGEPSVIAAQAHGVAAASITNSGERALPAPLLAELCAAWTGPILIALDCDAKGKAAAPKLAAQLQGAGLAASVVDLGGSAGFDLADFCRLHGLGSAAELAKRAQPAPSAPAQPSSLLIDANYTDAGNAECLVHVASDQLRYCHTRHKWLVWADSRWQIDDDGAARRLALDVVRERYTAAAQIRDLTRRTKAATWAIGSESSGRIKALLETAATMRPLTTTISAYDSDPMLAGVANGTLDLRTGALRPARRDDYITRALGAAHDPAATCPRWLQFMQEVFAGDAELIAFIQRAIGYSLTGDIREEVMFLLLGEGANGKSKFLEILRTLLGDYAEVSSFETFNAERKAEQTNDLAGLVGRRLVVAIETDEDRRLAEARVKSVTGGDQISCRFLYGEYFSYLPQFKIWLAMNHKPIIRGRDRGIWRRIRLIPFSQSFEANPDKELIVKLRAELPGILNWALAGLAAWRAQGLGYPAPVRDATEGYRREMDAVGQWLDEEAINETGEHLVASDAYNAYREWSQKRGERFPMTQTAWGRSMNERYRDTRKVVAGRKVTVYLDVRFRTIQDP